MFLKFQIKCKLCKHYEKIAITALLILKKLLLRGSFSFLPRSVIEFTLFETSYMQVTILQKFFNKMIIINEDYWLDLPFSFSFLKFLQHFYSINFNTVTIIINRDIVNKLLFRDLQERNWFAATNLIIKMQIVLIIVYQRQFRTDSRRKVLGFAMTRVSRTSQKTVLQFLCYFI